MKTSKIYGSSLFVGAVFFLLTFSPEAQAGGVDVHIGIGLPFPGYVVGPPVVYPPPPVVVVPPPYGYPRPVVIVPYGQYRRHYPHKDYWGKGGHRGYARERGRRW